jgi:surface polysaccharide O-acyltransferase-like enzyme
LSQEKAFSVPVDLIRTVAILGVLLLHAANDLTAQQMNSFEIYRWTVVDVYQSLGRTGVPLFIMLTGALLLQPSKVNEPIRVFLQKRWARIGLPVLFWGAIYFAWGFFVDHQTLTSSSIIQGILTGPSFQFWYIYMLVGLYLLTPVLRIVVAHADQNIMKYFVTLWILGVGIVPFISLLTTFHLDSNVLTITGFVGYYILGLYLLSVQMRRSTLLIFMSLGLALTSIGTYAVAATIGGGQMYFFQEYLSPTLILASVMLFLLLNTIQSPSNPTEKKPKVNSHHKFNKLLSVISENTLPIFLLHVIVLECLQQGYFGFTINGNTINSIIGVPLATVLTLFICLAIIVPLKRVPVLKRLLG